jgi:hypothetical protein
LASIVVNACLIVPTQPYTDSTQVFIDSCAGRFREDTMNAIDIAMPKVQATEIANVLLRVRMTARSTF